MANGPSVKKNGREVDSSGDSQESRVFTLARVTKQLFEERGVSTKGLTVTLWKQNMPPGAASRQGATTGLRARPFDFDGVLSLKRLSEHHSTCLAAKRDAIFGLGFVTPDDERRQKGEDPQGGDSAFSAVDRTLDPLCHRQDSFQEVLNDAGEDYCTLGNGYIEIVRESPRSDAPILGIYHQPAREVWVHVDDASGNFSYEIINAEMTSFSRTARRFARFGDLEGFVERHNIPEGQGVSELIHLRAPSSLSRYYGVPDWLAAISSIEIAQALKQHSFDFFVNRGVPEIMLFLLGKKVRTEDWEKIEAALQANVGVGNSHKSVAANITDPEMKVELHKLALEGKSDSSLFKDMSEALALLIVSAHRVPPLLAGIQIPGKLGANNELPNALMLFQVLLVEQAQRAASRKFIRTLGNPELNGGLGLASSDFLFNTITDKIGLSAQAMDTLGRMREPLPEAQAEGRDLGEGVRD